MGAFVIGFINRDSRLGQLYQSRGDAPLPDAILFGGEVADRVQEAGFRSLRFCETLWGDPEHLGSGRSEVRDGYGNGAFVVLGPKKLITHEVT